MPTSAKRPDQRSDRYLRYIEVGPMSAPHLSRWVHPRAPRQRCARWSRFEQVMDVGDYPWFMRNTLSNSTIRAELRHRDAARLAMNATTWTQRLTQGANDHGERRMKNTWPALAKVARIDPDFAEATLRHPCGLSAHPDAVRLERPSRSCTTPRRGRNPPNATLSKSTPH